MYRLFQTHHIRKSITLPEYWTLHIPQKDAFKIPIPSCVESIPQYSNYKGKCTIETRQRFGGDLRLTFKGVGHTANVSLDGLPLGSHYGAYGEFSFILRNQEDREHVISVDADNSYSEESALHMENDYYSYLGITRPVLLEQLNQAYIKWIHVTPIHETAENGFTDYSDGCWKLQVTVCAENITDKDLSLQLKLYISSSDESVENSPAVLSQLSMPILLKAGQTEEFSCTFQCQDVTAYMPDRPVMYYVHGQLADGVLFDDLIERFGFREVKVSGNQILFNGIPMTIKGFNRHEDYAEFGSSIPLTAMHRDICLIKNTGANCIRTCHYPNDERFLDLCDENGLFVWEEAHARSLLVEQMRNPHFMEQSRLTVTEMITWHYNHPSIYVWGLLNECASQTEYGRECYRELISLIRSLDASRPVTFASCRLFDDICLDLVDIVSYNIYPKWYGDVSCTQYIQKCRDYIVTHGGAGKPFLISETGGGAIYGYRSNIICKWTEEYQEQLLGELIPEIMEFPECSGVIIWQYADCRVDFSWAMNRPKTQNNKGIVDIYRREKLSYAKVKELFHKY